MKFLIGFNLVAFVLWYLYWSKIKKKKFPKNNDLMVVLITTIVCEAATLMLTT